jgi:hypothetical protein
VIEVGHERKKKKNGIISVTVKVDMKTIMGKFLVIEMQCATRRKLLGQGAQRKREKKMKKKKLKCHRTFL